jgi:hypothetical protein
MKAVEFERIQRLSPFKSGGVEMQRNARFLTILLHGVLHGK